MAPKIGTRKRDPAHMRRHIDHSLDRHLAEIRELAIPHRRRSMRNATALLPRTRSGGLPPDTLYRQDIGKPGFVVRLDAHDDVARPRLYGNLSKEEGRRRTALDRHDLGIVPGEMLEHGTLAIVNDHLLVGMRELVYKRSLPLATRDLKLVVSPPDPNAGMVGTAILVVEEQMKGQNIESVILRHGVPSEAAS